MKVDPDRVQREDRILEEKTTVLEVAEHSEIEKDAHDEQRASPARCAARCNPARRGPVDDRRKP